MKQNAVISEMTLEELKDALAEQRDQYTKIKIQHTVSPLENTTQLPATRRLIAKMETELRKRQTEQG